MPAYNFKERFVPLVEEGSKRHTIRPFRSHPTKPGQLAHLFTGMRTKWCRKLIDPAPVIADVKAVIISSSHLLLLDGVQWLSEEERAHMLKHGTSRPTRWLSVHECDLFAHNDGFRFEGDPVRTVGCSELMKRWWGGTYDLPWIGQVIYW